MGGRSRGRFATPADFPPHDCSPYSHVHERRECLGFVHHSRTIFCRPVRATLALRFATFSSLYGVDGWSTSIRQSITPAPPARVPRASTGALLGSLCQFLTTRGLFRQSKLPGYVTLQRSIKTLWQVENETRSFGSMSDYLEDVDGRKPTAGTKAYQGAVQDFDWVRKRRDGMRNDMRKRNLLR